MNNIPDRLVLLTKNDVSLKSLHYMYLLSSDTVMSIFAKNYSSLHKSPCCCRVAASKMSANSSHPCMWTEDDEIRGNFFCHAIRYSFRHLSKDRPGKAFLSPEALAVYRVLSTHGSSSALIEHEAATVESLRDSIEMTDKGEVDLEKAKDVARLYFCILPGTDCVPSNMQVHGAASKVLQQHSATSQDHSRNQWMVDIIIKRLKLAIFARNVVSGIAPLLELDLSAVKPFAKQDDHFYRRTEAFSTVQDVLFESEFRRSGWNGWYKVRRWIAYACVEGGCSDAEEVKKALCFLEKKLILAQPSRRQTMDLRLGLTSMNVAQQNIAKDCRLVLDSGGSRLFEKQDDEALPTTVDARSRCARYACSFYQDQSGRWNLLW